MFSSPPWSRLAVVVGLAVAVGLTGCSANGSNNGAGSNNGVASLSGASSSAAAPGGSGQRPDPATQDALIKYAQCMRQHGINMPDPQGNGRMAAIAGADPKADPAGAQKAQAANTACAKDLPNGGKPTPADLQKQLKFAQCMRQHGVNEPDPSPTGGGQGISINLGDPATKAAVQACDPAMAGGTSNGG